MSAGGSNNRRHRSNRRFRRLKANHQMLGLAAMVLALYEAV
jgi:hypothetical protein